MSHESSREPTAENERRYWFPAKRRGFGWSAPNSWQGWLVVAVFTGLVMAGGFLFPPNSNLVLFVIYVIPLVVLLTLVCWLKGEPLRWR